MFEAANGSRAGGFRPSMRFECKFGKYGKFTLPTPEPRKYFPRAEDPMSLRRETRWDEFLGFWGSTCPKTAAHRQT